MNLNGLCFPQSDCCLYVSTDSKTMSITSVNETLQVYQIACYILSRWFLAMFFRQGYFIFIMRKIYSVKCLCLVPRKDHVVSWLLDTQCLTIMLKFFNTIISNLFFGGQLANEI